MASTLVEAEPASGPPVRGDRTLAARRRRVPYLLLAPGGFYLMIFFIVPMVLMVLESLKSGGLLSGGFHFTWQFSNYTKGISGNSGFFLRSIRYSATVTVAGLLLAYPLAYWIAFYGGRWKSSLLLLMLLPFFVSFVIRTIMWKWILADNGSILGFLKGIHLLPHDFHVLATEFAVIAGMTYNFLPFTALPLYVALERIDKGLVEAAKDLYATRWEAFRKVVVPLSMPGIFAAVLLTFVPATGDYIDAEILGNAGTTMIGNVIQRKFLVNNLYPEAAALSAVLMIGMLVLASIYARALGTEDSALAAAAV